MLRSLAALVGAFAVLAARVAHSSTVDSESAALRWVRGKGADTCPTESDVARAVEQQLGRAAFVPEDRADLLIEATLEQRSGGGYHVAITMRRGDSVVGQRELESDEGSCQALAEKAILVIALTIDPDAPPQTVPTISVAPVAPTPSPSSLPKPVSPVPAPAVAEPWHVDLELAGGIATGTVPNVAPGVFLRGRALPPGLPIGIELEAAYFPSQRVEDVPGKGADFALAYAGTALCNRNSRTARLGLLGCAGPELGAVQGQGFGFADNPAFSTWTLALAARGRLAVRPTAGFALLVGPDFWLPLKRDDFESKAPGTTNGLFRMSAVGVGVELGVVVEL